jgi:WD40 repeat protein
MELVRGIRITEYCDQNCLAIADRLRLFIAVCQAIQHAHQKGVIHRDIKPSNILVTLHDGVPVPKVIDFGIAKAIEQKLTDKTLFTAFDAFIGTPAYMRPEQAQLSGLDVDTRSDIYSLGVLLYELVTGQPPFDPGQLMRSGLDECRRTIRETEPARPSPRLSSMPAAELTATAGGRCTDPPRLVSLLRGDLDWIVMKCLEKDRRRRYDSANALAEDVRHYLEDEPVLARPPSRLYRTRKFVRRNRLTVGAAVFTALILVVSAGVSTWQAVRASRAETAAEASRRHEAGLRQRAEKGWETARLNEYVADMGLAHQSILAGNLGRALELVEKHRPKPGERDLRGFEWRYLWQLCRGNPHTALPTQETSVSALAVSPDGQRLAVGSLHELALYDFHTGALLARAPRGAVSLGFLPDGPSLVAANQESVQVWRGTDGRERTSLPRATGPAALSADGRRLATQGGDAVQIWDTSNWNMVQSLPGAHGPVVFSPEGTRLVSGSSEGTTVWALQPDAKAVVLQDSPRWSRRPGRLFNADRAIAFSADGKRVIMARNEPSRRGVFVLGLWDADRGREVAIMPEDPDRQEHVGVIASLVLSPDGRRLATASWDHSIRLWDLEHQRLERVLQGHLNEVWSLAFSPDGRNLVSGSKDGGVNVWPLLAEAETGLLPANWFLLAVSRGGESMAAVNPQGKLGFFDTVTYELQHELTLDPAPGIPDPGSRRPPGPDPVGLAWFGLLAVSADLGAAAWVAPDDRLEWRNLHDGTQATLRPARLPATLLALSPDGKVLLSGAPDRSLQWWEPDRSREPAGTRPLFAGDGSTLAVFDGPESVQIWDVRTRSKRTHFVARPASSPGVALSADGHFLATADGAAEFANRAYLWSTESGKLVGQCVGHKQPAYAIAFTPDGRALATAGDDGSVKLWNVATQQELISLRRLGSRLDRLSFQAEGQFLVAHEERFGSPQKLWSLRVPPFRLTDPLPQPETKQQ